MLFHPLFILPRQSTSIQVVKHESLPHYQQWDATIYYITSLRVQNKIKNEHNKLARKKVCSFLITTRHVKVLKINPYNISLHTPMLSC